VEILRKLERNNLCSLVTIPRHECGQRVANLMPETRSAPPRRHKTLPELGSLLPRTSENSSSPTLGEKGPVGREDGISVPNRVMASIVQGRGPLVL